MWLIAKQSMRNPKEQSLSTWLVVLAVGLWASAGCRAAPLGPGDDHANVESVSGALTTCTPGNRAYCSWMGTCDAAGKQCVCDDPQHWWVSDRCSVWHANPPLQPGQVCSPGENAYCNYMGTCNASGTGCTCGDSQHRRGTDRCMVWYPGPPLEPGQVCSPGEEAYCYFRGTCNAGGTGCTCTDPLHFWASDNCATWHEVPQPPSPTTGCAQSVWLNNYTSTPDGMHDNGTYLGFSLVTSQSSGAGLSCTYSRPSQDGYDVFIGRNLKSDEVTATLVSDDAWSVTKSDGTSITVTCPFRAVLGQASYYRSAGSDVLVQTPLDWVVTQNEFQSVPFSHAGTGIFAMQCNYRGFSDVVVYVPPPVRPISAAACPGFYTAGASLSTRLAACPGLADLLVWEDGAGNITSHSGFNYPSWTEPQKARLDQLFAAMQPGESDLGLDCPVPAEKLWTEGQTNDSSGNPVFGSNAISMFFTANQAFYTYAAHVAWTLYVEANHLVPWSILGHPVAELVEFFDSRRHHTRFVARDSFHELGYMNPANLPAGIQEGRDFWNATSRKNAGWEVVCDPRVGYQFLSGLNSNTSTNLLGSSELATLKNLTWWFYKSVSHGYVEEASTSGLLANSSFTLSNRLQARAHGTPPSQPLVIANKGCHSAANLFYDLAKSVNIPVLHVASLEPSSMGTNFPNRDFYIGFGTSWHSGLVYGWGDPLTTRVLQHADDIYAMYGLVFPVNVSGQQASDPAQSLFAETWLMPEGLAPWNYHSLRDYRPQTAFTRYGNPGDTAVGTQGILAGYWIPTANPSNANLWRFYWNFEGRLCSYGSGVMASMCAASDATIESSWMSAFGSNVIDAPFGGGDEVTASQYRSHLQTCAMAYTGLTSASEACGQFAGSSSPYYLEWQNRTATSAWWGPTGM